MMPNGLPDLHEKSGGGQQWFGVLPQELLPN
jgi:hypothetical protein